jgi:hypothetical protein
LQSTLKCLEIIFIGKFSYFSCSSTENKVFLPTKNYGKLPVAISDFFGPSIAIFLKVVLNRTKHNGHCALEFVLKKTNFE